MGKEIFVGRITDVVERGDKVEIFLQNGDGSMVTLIPNELAATQIRNKIAKLGLTPTIKAIVRGNLHLTL